MSFDVDLRDGSGFTIALVGGVSADAAPGVGTATATGYAPTVSTAAFDWDVTDQTGAVEVTWVGTPEEFTATGDVGEIDIVWTFGGGTDASVETGLGTATAAGLGATLEAGASAGTGAGAAQATGLAPGVSLGADANPGAGSATAQGLSPTVSVGVGVDANPGGGSAAGTGHAPTVAAGAALAAGLGAGASGGAAPTVAAGAAAEALLGAAVAGGYAPDVASGSSLSVSTGAGSVTAEGNAITLVADAAVTPAGNDLLLAGHAPFVTNAVVLFTENGTPITAEDGSPLVPEDAVGGDAERELGAGALAAVGHELQVSTTSFVLTTTGALAITPHSPALAGEVLPPTGTGALVAIGLVPEVTASSAILWPSGSPYITTEDGIPLLGETGAALDLEQTRGIGGAVVLGQPPIAEAFIDPRLFTEDDGVIQGEDGTDLLREDGFAGNVARFPGMTTAVATGFQPYIVASNIFIETGTGSAVVSGLPPELFVEAPPSVFTGSVTVLGLPPFIMADAAPFVPPFIAHVALEEGGGITLESGDSMLLESALTAGGFVNLQFRGRAPILRDDRWYDRTLAEARVIYVHSEPRTVFVGQESRQMTVPGKPSEPSRTIIVPWEGTTKVAAES